MGGVGVGVWGGGGGGDGPDDLVPFSLGASGKCSKGNLILWIYFSPSFFKKIGTSNFQCL